MPTDEHKGILARLKEASAQMRSGVQQELDRRGIVRMHQFPDGRVLSVRKKTANARETFSWQIVNQNTGFCWDGMVGYHSQQDCIHEAEQTFGVQRWNVL